MFLLFPYHVDAPLERRPYANWGLIAVTCLVSLLLFGAERETLVGWALSQKHFSILQPFSHLFLHADWLHLGGNMFFLFVFGNAVNAKLGHWQYLLLYFGLGGLVGLVGLIFYHGFLAGASGAIMGIIGIYLVLFPRNDISLFYLVIFRFGWVEIAGLWVILTYLGFDIWGAIRTAGQAGGGVAYLCHVFGLLFGAAAGTILVLSGRAPPTRWERNLLQVLGFRPDAN